MDLPLYTCREILEYLDVDILRTMKTGTKLFKELVTDENLVVGIKNTTRMFLPRPVIENALGVPLIAHYISVLDVSKNFVKYLNSRKELWVLLYRTGISRILRILCKYGSDDVIIWLKQQIPEIDVDDFSFQDAVENGHSSTLLVIKKYFPNFVPLRWSGSYHNAVYYGMDNVLSVLKDEFPYIMHNNDLYNEFVYGRAEFSRQNPNDPDIDKYDRVLTVLKDKFPELDPPADLLDCVIGRGDEGTVRFIHRNFPHIQCPDSVRSRAMKYERYDIVKLLNELYPQPPLRIYQLSKKLSGSIIFHKISAIISPIIGNVVGITILYLTIKHLMTIR